MPAPRWLVRLLGRLANEHFLVRHGHIASESQSFPSDALFYSAWKAADFAVNRRSAAGADGERTASATAGNRSSDPYGFCAVFDKELRKRNEK
jgi:hypothetical protein